MIAYCYFLFIADIPFFLFCFCSVLMMETLWVLPRSILMPWMRAGDLPPGGNVVRFFSRWPFTSWILCFLNSFWGSNAVCQGIKLNTRHKLKWGCLFFFFSFSIFLFFSFLSFFLRYPTLICIFRFLFVASLIVMSSIQRNNLYFDNLTITFWRQLYKPFVSVPLSQRSSEWLTSTWVWW